MIKRISIAVLLAYSTGPLHAQGALDKLIGSTVSTLLEQKKFSENENRSEKEIGRNKNIEVEMNKQKKEAINSSKITLQLPSNEDEYCQAVFNDPTVKKYQDIVRTVWREKLNEDRDIWNAAANGLDNSQKILREWVKDKINNSGNVEATLGVIDQYARNCAVKHARDTDNRIGFYVELPFQKERTSSSLKKMFNDHDLEYKKTEPTKRQALDEFGKMVDIVEQTKYQNSLKQFDIGILKSAPYFLGYIPIANGGRMISNSPNDPATKEISTAKVAMIAIALPGGDKAIESSSKETIDKVTKLVADKLSVREKTKASDDTATKANEAKKREFEKEFEKLQNFLNTPPGKLWLSYHHYQIIQACYDIRKGYKAVFINEVENEKLLAKMKEIEKSLKVNKEDTERMWKKAQGENVGAPGSELAAVSVKLVKSSEYDVQSNICNATKQEFVNVHEEIVGVVLPSKNF